MKEILLTKGKVASVDDEDFESLNAFKWYAQKDHNTFYAIRASPRKNGKYHHIYMHREVMNIPDEMQIDHIDRNGLNNQKSNLRIVTHQQNAFNRNAKGYIFRKDRQKFQAQIRLNGKLIYLGDFETELGAHAAYLEAKKIYHVI